MGWDGGEPSQGFHAREPGHTSLDPQLQLRPQMGVKDWKKAGSSWNTVSLGSRYGEDMGADQQLGLTRKRDWAGSTGRAGRSDDRQRLACLFCIGSSPSS
jgi:hypothetical protein